MKRINAIELVGHNLTVRDLMRVDYDIDVYDDVYDGIGVAFCNPFYNDEDVHKWDEYLTDEGMKLFGDVLDLPMEIMPEDMGYDFPCAVIHFEDNGDGVWKKNLNKARKFFNAMAGYASCEDYDKWFKL